jgi:hypothetical protein
MDGTDDGLTLPQSPMPGIAAAGVRGDEPRSAAAFGTDLARVDGDLPPLCNTGGNSPSGEDRPADLQPAQVALGWLKIRHSRESYAVWSLYRVTLGMANGAETCPASKQRRLFGVRMHWGGFEYWGFKTPDMASDGADQNLQSDYTVKHTAEEVEVMRKDIPGLRVPEGDTVLTEWSDDALLWLGIYLRGDSQTVMGLLSELLVAGAAVTRLDISADFAATAIDPVVASMYAKDFLPMRVDEFHDSRGKGPTGGRTCYFGRRGNDGGGVFVRFYEKGREQGLPVDLLRYEIELSGDKAQDAAKKLVAGGEGWASVGASILAGAIDFRDGYGELRGTAHAHRDCERSAWWSLLLTRLAAAVKLQRVARPDATLLSMRDWVEKNLGRVLAILRSWMGDARFWGWLRGVVDDGAERMTDRDLAILRDAQRYEVPF